VRIAVDVCVGRRGVKMLLDAGHDVFCAEHAEPDREWFARAMKWGVELVVAADSDIEILAYDANVRFFCAAQGDNDREIARKVLYEIEHEVV
jgi:hypothetical protein